MAVGGNPLLEDDDDDDFTPIFSAGQNPLLDDDDEEYAGEFSIGLAEDLPENIKLPSEIPATLPATLALDTPISDDSSLPDLSSMLGDLHLESDRVDSGFGGDLYTGDAFEVDPFSSELLDNDGNDEDDDFDPLSTPLDTLLQGGLIDGWDSEPVVPRRSIDDFTSSNNLLEDTDSEDEFSVKSLDLDLIISSAIDAGASDIHLSPGDNVTFTVLGKIARATEFGIIDPNQMVTLEQSIISYVLQSDFTETLELDASYVAKSGKYKGRRLRLSVGKSGGEIVMTFRVIADIMPTPDELGIPQVVRDWFNLPSGLVLVNGPTGSGKSTSLSSLVQEIQFNRAEKVITIEKPVEFIYGIKPGQKAFITQREVGKDTRSFAAALTSSMRQAPDIILVGEVRNREEVDELLRAAETGHLAISTLHTTSCPGTINRIRTMYQGDEQVRILATLSDNLRGLMTQTLVISADGTKRVAVREILPVDRVVKEMILKGDVQGLRHHMEEKGITMEHELLNAARRGEISMKSAREKSPIPLYFDEIAAQ